MTGSPHDPVSPIELLPLNAPRPGTSPTGNTPVSALRTTSNTTKASWLPFTSQWYYLVVPTTLSLCFGALLVYLTIISQRNHGLGADDGSSGILFGWRFTPTLIAVLYAQMTVILFEDVKRTEPFARLANAPAGGASAYGTILQTPRAWWSIFIDVCFNRKRIGKTSWALICATCVNVIALLAISPLSSALLTSEEVLVPRTVAFTRMVPKVNVPLPALPIRETYFRTISAVTRNISTSAWVGNNALTLPFWPSSEAAQFGPNLDSPYSAWKTETTTLHTEYKCQNMTLESANMSNQRYSGVYDFMLRGPLNGTQPMVKFVLTSGDGCRYELSMHPSVDLAWGGGVTWSNASTYFLTSQANLPLGGRLLARNVTSTHVYARINASEQCKGKDILIMNTPWTDATSLTDDDHPFIRVNATYKRSPSFEMRALLCESRYFMSKSDMTASITGSQTTLNVSSGATTQHQDVSKNFVDTAAFQAISMQDEWRAYFDDTTKDGLMNSIKQNAGVSEYSGSFSGMAPLLGALSNFNVSAMLRDPSIAQKAAVVKGRFFAETLRETFNNPAFVEQEQRTGEVTMVEERVVVLSEIGIALAVLFFVASILLALIFWSSRLQHRKLNLKSDPASTVGISLLLDQQHLSRAATLRTMHNASRPDLYMALQRDKHLTSGNTLLKGDENTDPPFKVKPRSNWKPRVIHIKMLVAFSLLLILILVAILTLNAFSGRAKLSQLAFIYEADLSKYSLSFSTFAPISIAPTVVSIVIGLWWDQLDSTFRILQPYIAMSRGPTPINKGAGLTYRSKTWLGAAIKAARNRHWVLLMIAIGSVLAQVLTVSMSALFERQTHNTVQKVQLKQGLEIRQTPILSEIDAAIGDEKEYLAVKVLEDLYTDASRNWLYGAGVQHSFNSTQLPWTSQGWSFLPVDFSDLPKVASKGSVAATNDNVAINRAVNITLQVPAIRARLNCTPVDEIANDKSFLEVVDLSESEDSYFPQDWAQINSTGLDNLYRMPADIFANTSSHTTVLGTPMYLKCCGNGTLANPQRGVIGYWSPNLPPAWEPSGPSFPYVNFSWPLTINTKWIVGKPMPLQDYGGSYGSRKNTVFFREKPEIQAANCRPIIESAYANVMLDKDSRNIQHFDILNITTASDAAWKDVFTGPLAESGPRSNNSQSIHRMATSYGVLFLDSMLGSSNRRNYLRAGVMDPEDLNNNAFVFRDPKTGLNTDLMSYSMYTLAGKNPEALLNYTTLVSHAEVTFQNFFQQFVNSDLSLTKGGYVYQPVNQQSLGGSGATSGKRDTVAQPGNTITAEVSQRIRVLHLNTVATYLSAAILIWLILTTFIVVCIQRRYTSFMIRDVQLIADMLVLVAGSDNFLELVASQGVALKRSKDVKTMLGWFKDRNGEVRWGVEVVGGHNAVDWVDAPKQGFHVPKNPSKSTWVPWRK